MELEPGFKLSEAGPIPEDWASPELLVHLKQRATYGIVKAGLQSDVGVPMLRGGDIQDGCIAGELPCVSPAKSEEFRRTILQEGDVVIALVGYPGEAAKVLAQLAGANISRAVGLLRLDGSLEADFLVSYLNSAQGRERTLRPSAGSAQIVVNLDALNKLPIPTPAPEEQLAIAAASAAIDEWIASVEGEAAKLASVKAAAMHALLTPTTRLPGFSGEWCPVRIGDLYDPLSTVAVARAGYVDGDGVACIHYGDIHVRYDGFVRVGHDEVAAVPAGLVRSAARLLSGDVLIADAAEDLEGVGKAVELIAPANFQVVGGLHVQALRPKAGKLALGFAGYLFRQRAYRNAVERAASGLKVYGIAKSQLSALEVVLPPTLDEQQAIAAVLSDIDAALSAARAVVVKARSIKAAAMDALLSGRVRLPGFEPARRASADALEAA